MTGLRLLEAAAVPGEPLALDALHDALGPAVSAQPSPSRVAVAMSGGVDSAVALLEARDAGHEPVGVTLRLWTDPPGRTASVCCSPAAVVAARELCHGLGAPHVTLDLREGFRRAVVKPFVAGYGRGETPNPCIRCNGSFRFAALLAFARRIGAARLATGHYARVREHRGRLLLARAADAAKDQSYMLARLDPRLLDRVWFPLGASTKEETRERAAQPGSPLRAAPRARRPASSPGVTTATSSSVTASTPRRARSSTKAATRLRATTASGASRRASAAGSASPPASRSMPCAPSRGRTRSSSGRAPRSRARRSPSVPAGCTSPSSAPRPSSATGPPAPASVEPTARGFRLALDEPAYGVATGQAAVLYEEDVVVGAGVISAVA